MIIYIELNWYIVTNQYCALCNSFYYRYYERNKHSNTKLAQMIRAILAVRPVQPAVHDMFSNLFLLDA